MTLGYTISLSDHLICHLNLTQELKQDISSFRFEVLGLLRGSKLSTIQSGNAAASSADADEKSHSEGNSKDKKKNLSLFDLTTLIHPRSAAIASERHTISNGSALVVQEPPREKQRKVNFVADIKNFGLFHRRSKQNAAEQNANQIFSVSEEIARQQAAGPLERNIQLESQGLASRGDLSIPGLNEQCVLVDHRERNTDTLGLQVGKRVCSFKSEKVVVDDTVPIIPKKKHAHEEDSSIDYDLSPTDTAAHEDYVTTRLWQPEEERSPSLYILSIVLWVGEMSEIPLSNANWHFLVFIYRGIATCNMFEQSRGNPNPPSPLL